MAKGNGGTRVNRGGEITDSPAPINYTMVKEETPTGGMQVSKYVSKDDSSVEIRIERGSFQHDNPTGFQVYHNGELFDSVLTLTEAKESAKYYAQRGWKK